MLRSAVATLIITAAKPAARAAASTTAIPSPVCWTASATVMPGYWAAPIANAVATPRYTRAISGRRRHSTVAKTAKMSARIASDMHQVFTMVLAGGQSIARTG